MSGDADNLDRLMVIIKSPPRHLTSVFRRARLLAFLAPFTTRNGGYEIRVGSARLSAEVLSDDALEDLAARVVDDFWSHRRRVRLNRPHYAAAAVAAGHRLPPETSRLAAALLRIQGTHAA